MPPPRPPRRPAPAVGGPPPARSPARGRAAGRHPDRAAGARSFPGPGVDHPVGPHQGRRDGGRLRAPVRGRRRRRRGREPAACGASSASSSRSASTAPRRATSRRRAASWSSASTGASPTRSTALVELPGVGRKTANLVLIEGFAKPAMCVDTHVHRICNLWGLVETRTPAETEMALRRALPRRYWLDWNRLLVSFGQHTCVPISPRCSTLSDRGALPAHRRRSLALTAKKTTTMTAETPLSATPATPPTRAWRAVTPAPRATVRDRRARTLFSSYSGLTGCYDEIVDGDGQFRRDAAPIRAPARRAGAARDGAPPAPGRRRVPPGRHHVLGVLRQPRRREDLPVRPHPARRHRARVDQDRARARSSASRRSTSSSPTSTDRRRSCARSRCCATWCSPRPGTCRRWTASSRRSASTCTSPASIWCAAPTARSSCSRTTCGCRRASPT